MRNSPLKELLAVGTAALGLTLIVGLATRFPALLNSDSSYAASCGSNTYLLANFTDYQFSTGTVRPNEVIYNNDSRFSFFSVPDQLNNSEYVKTENVGLKDSINDNYWAVYMCKPGKVYVLYRRITGQTPPSWITSAYQKESPNSVNPSDLSQFVVRKNTSNALGLYDVYSRTLNSPDIVKFEGASSNQNQAHSMYIVALKPNTGGSTPTNTPRPSTTSTPSVTNSPRPGVETPRPTVIGTPQKTGAPTATPRPTVTAAPTQPPSGGNAQYPAQVLNLTNWKITLPLSGAPETKQPALATFKHDTFFRVNAGGGVLFRAPVNGGTTGGSSYARSELREMANNGTSNASWSTSSGKHSLYIDQMVTKLPNTKPHVVVGQIHDGGDDVTVFRVEGSQLWITNGDSTHGHLVDGNFQLNKRFTVKFEVQNNVTRYYYNGNLLAYSLNQSYSGAYFKAGAYTQANCGNSSPCSADNYGEVIIYDLQLSHQ